MIENKGASLQGNSGADWWLKIARDSGVAGHGGGPVEISYFLTMMLVLVTWLPASRIYTLERRVGQPCVPCDRSGADPRSTEL